MIGMLLGGPFWGMIADKWHCHRIIIIIMCILSLFFMGVQPFIIIKYGDPSVNKCPYSKQTIQNGIRDCGGNNTSVLDTILNGLYYTDICLLYGHLFTLGSPYLMMMKG